MANRHPEPLFAHSSHEVSGRCAVLEEVEGSIWLYLMRAEGEPPELDCWLANTIAHHEQQAPEHYRSAHLPPPAPPSLVSGECVIASPSAHAWSLRWSADGGAVAALCDGRVLGFLCSRRMAAYSHHLTKDCPWGHMWRPDVFEAIYGRLAN